VLQESGNDLLDAALIEQQQELAELDEELSSLPSIQEERDKIYALVTRMRYNLNLPTLGSDPPALIGDETSVEPTDRPVLRKTLAALEIRLAALNKQLDDFKESRLRRDNVRALIALMKESMPAAKPPVPIEITMDDSLGLTDAVAASPEPLWITMRRILSRSRTPLSIAMLTDTLRGLGYSKVTPETVRSAISRRSKIFQRRGDGFVVIDVPPEEQEDLSDLLRVVLSANPGRPMALPEIESVIDAMGVKFKEPENASKRISIMLRRLGSKQDSGVTVIYGSEVDPNGGPPIIHGPMQFVWNDSFPKPSPDVPFPSEM
jgi:hypothetical protein